MATVLVSFIGRGNYQSCNYVFDNDHRYETHLFVSALSEFYKEEIDRLIVFLTEESRNAKRPTDELTYFQQLEKLHSEKRLVTPEEIIIKSGKSEQELWEIFETIASNLHKGDELIFDITHAFRSIPILSLLVIAFLRETKEIKLKAIVYGAFEAKDENGNAPVFNLTPFVDLLDWLSATKQFKTTGNANLLVELLEKNNDRNLARTIKDLSESLRLLRPVFVMEKSQRLSGFLKNETAKSFVKAKPVLQLFESIQESYSEFDLSEPKEEKNKEKFIQNLFKLAKWYYKKGQYVQSIATVRELIPTLVCYKMYFDFFRYEDNRKIAEAYLNQRDDKAPKDTETIKYDWDETRLPIKLKEFWQEVTNVRNDVLHVGFNESPRKIDNIIKKNKEFIEQLEPIVSELTK